MACEDFIADIAQRFTAVRPEFLRGHHALVAVGYDIINSIDEIWLCRGLIAGDRSCCLRTQVDGSGRLRSLSRIRHLSGIDIRWVRRIIIALGSGLAFTIAVRIAVTVDVAISTHRVLRSDNGADIRSTGLIASA